MPGQTVIQALFPPDLPEPATWERRYPPRPLPERAEVTRFAPSPTGHLHIGGLYTAAVSRALAHQTDGVHLLRIEDTDEARRVAGAAESFVRQLGAFGLAPDEGGAERGAEGGNGGGDGPGSFGPYRQSERREIYLGHVRDLLRRDLAYVCFCDAERLARNAEEQRASRSPIGYYGSWARCRSLSDDAVARLLATGAPYVIRFRCPHGLPGRVRFDDRIRGPVVMQDNGNDVVLLKSSRNVLTALPTYHLAHVVDDHLMRVTLVVRGEEWLSSTPLHLQLHAALGFDPPRYAHLAPLMKAEAGSRRKLSKRKDPEAAVDYYLAAGYPPAAVQHYLRGIANSRLMDLSTDEALTAPLRIEEMRAFGPLLDLPKLRSISRELIAAMPAGEIHRQLSAWAAEHDAELSAALEGSRLLTRQVIAVAQGVDHRPRKDLVCWSDFRDRYGFFYRELFDPPLSPADDRFGGLDPELISQVTEDFVAHYRHDAGPADWLAGLRGLADRHGFAPDTSSWRQAPERYAGQLGRLVDILRIQLTGAARSPDLFAVAQALGQEEVLRRLLPRA